MNVQVAADLLAAAELLERDGWCQGHFRNERGQHCIRGALIYVTGSGVRLTDADEALYAFAGGYRGARWNDMPGRTQSEVVELLRSAACGAGDQEQPNE